MSAPIYLDYAAATPLDERVFVAMQPYMRELFYNPSAAYLPAKRVKQAIDEARHSIAVGIGAKRDEIVITAGATESINLAFHGLLGSADKVVIGATEHASVREIAQQYDVTIVPADAKGVIQPEKVHTCITDETVLVSITAADSELGTIQPIAKIAQVIKEVKRDRATRGVDTPLYLHTDASQAVGAVDLHVARLGVDLMTLNAAKCYGPKQVGLLYINSMVSIRPLIVGGGQERGLRSGTENVAGIIGFAKALSLAVKYRHSQSERMRLLRDKLEDGLTSSLPELVINGSTKKRLPGHLNVSLEGLDAERVVFHLDSLGIYVATGAACAANKATRSPVLVATGMSNSLADGSLRFTMGRQTTETDIERAIPLIVEAIRTEASV